MFDSEKGKLRIEFDKIIRLGETDLASYKELRARGLKEHPEAFAESAEHFERRALEELRERMPAHGKTGGFTLIAVSKTDELLGTVSLARDAGEAEQHRAQLWGMYVIPEARGLAIGQKLIGELVRGR